MGTRGLRQLAVATGLVLGVLMSPAIAEEAAEVPLGLWQTEPDMLGVVLHVRTRTCGRSLCARVERAKNRRGLDAPSNAVGKKVMWAMKPQPDGAFFGEYRNPSAKVYTARVEVAGKKLRMKACDADSCLNTIWVRVK